MTKRLDHLLEEVRKEASESALPKCVVCGNPPESINQFYRCWDCKSPLCEEHVLSHFGQQHQPHPIIIREILEPLEGLASVVEKIESKLFDTNRTNDVMKRPIESDPDSETRRSLLYSAKRIIDRLQTIIAPRR